MIRFRRVVALSRRDFLITKSYKLPFALDVFYGVGNLVVFFFISRVVGTPTGALLQGAPTYFDFAAVGAALGVATGAASTGITGRLREEQLTGTLEALIVQPIRPRELAIGLAGFPLVFATLRAIFYLFVVGALLGLDLSNTDLVGALVLLVLSAFMFAVLGIGLSSLVFLVYRGEVLSLAGMFVLELLGGALFPIEVFPDVVEPLARIAPTRFVFDGFRSALFRGGGWGDDALVIGVLAVIGLPMAVWLFSFGLRVALSRGSIAGY